MNTAAYTVTRDALERAHGATLTALRALQPTGDARSTDLQATCDRLHRMIDQITAELSDVEGGAK